MRCTSPWARVWLVTIGLMAVSGCATDNQTAPKPETSNSAAPKPENEDQAAARAAVSDSFQVKSGFKPVYQVVTREDMSTPLASRWTVRIALPAHLKREEVEQNLRYAAKEQWDQSRPDALSVFAYRKGSNYEGVVTAGQCDYAPYGDWSRASKEIPMSQYKLVIELEDAYFQR